MRQLWNQKCTRRSLEQITAKKEFASKGKREDIKRAIEDEIILIENFQAVKLAPFTHANAFYYKTKPACHHSKLYDVVKKQATVIGFQRNKTIN